jgi:RimJ/RimL family protein N-acetyltransferase
MQIVLETDRLRLRRFAADDVDLLVDLDSDPEVKRYIDGGKATPREEVENVVLPRILSYYERFDSYGYWAAEEKSSGEFVGWFALHPKSTVRRASSSSATGCGGPRGGRATRAKVRARSSTGPSES